MSNFNKSVSKVNNTKRIFCKPASTERTKKLKNLVNEAQPEVFTDRVRLETLVYKETEEDPSIIRRAKVFKKLAEEMSIYIQDGELLVGNQASKPRGTPVFLEYKANWVEKELDTFEKRHVDKFVVTDSTKKTIRENLPYWIGRTVKSRVRALLPRKTIELLDAKYPVFSPQTTYENSVGHFIVDYEKVLKNGFHGIRKQVENKIKNIDLSKPDDLQKLVFYKALIIVCDAAVVYAQRYSQLAKQLAKKEDNLQRKKELEKISKVCKRVPEYPARDFYEAIQSYLFVQFLVILEVDAQAISLGRFDKIVYPYYKKDIEKGVLTKEKALELLECFYVKLFEVAIFNNIECAQYFSGYPVSENLILGGYEEGNHNGGINELSYLCLEAEARMKFTQPALSISVYCYRPTSCERSYT